MRPPPPPRHFIRGPLFFNPFRRIERIISLIIFVIILFIFVYYLIFGSNKSVTNKDKQDTNSSRPEKNQ